LLPSSVGGRFHARDRRLEAVLDRSSVETGRFDRGLELRGSTERRVEPDAPFGQIERPPEPRPAVEVGDHEDAAGREDPGHLRETPLPRGEVMERIDHDDGVDRPVRMREIGRARLDGFESPSSRPSQHPPGGIDDCRPDLAGDPTGSAADLQDPIDLAVGDGEALPKRDTVGRWHEPVVHGREQIEGTDVPTHDGGSSAGHNSVALNPPGMEPRLLGWPEDGPTLRLDHRRFSYAGKFVMSNTGKAVIRASDLADEGEVSEPSTSEPPGEPTPSGGGSDAAGEYDTDVLAAVAFDGDRTDPDTLRLRYVTVRADLRGNGLGPRLCRFLARRAADRGYDRLRIAVNNPFAYQALYRAGFSFTGEETGIAELVLERPTTEPAEDRSEATYQDGLDAYRARELSAAERAFLDRRRGRSPPSPE